MRYAAYIPLIMVLAGYGLGEFLANASDITGWIGGLVGAVVAFFASRALLRTLYNRDLH